MVVVFVVFVVLLRLVEYVVVRLGVVVAPSRALSLACWVGCNGCRYYQHCSLTEVHV